jgi:hypothetical protein
MSFAYKSEDMTAAASTFTTLSGDAENMVLLAADADPDWYTWGLAGLAFVGMYSSTATKVREQLTQVSRSLDAHHRRLEYCRSVYEESDEDTEATIAETESRMDGGTWLPFEE